MRKLPKYFTLVLIAASSVFLLKAQDQDISIPFRHATLTRSGVSAHSAKALKKDTVPNNYYYYCYCSVFPEISPIISTGPSRSYKVSPGASCSAITTTPGESPIQNQKVTAFDTCSVINVSYNWSVSSGTNVVEINGSNTDAVLNLSVTGSGTFTLQALVTVTCRDGSTCSESANYTDTATVETKQCTCQTAPVTITPSGRNGNTWSYSGAGPGTCTGQYGTAPSFQDCNVQNVRYQWSLTGNGVAALAGPADRATVNVSITGNGKFSLRLEITTECNDGQRCSNYNFYEDVAEVPEPKSCSCSVDVDCERGADQGELRFYSGVLKGGCTGEYGSSPPYLPCSIKNVTWQWSITKGSDVVEFASPPNLQTVSVRIKGTGTYELRVQADVECSDGTKSCGEFNFDYCMDSASVDKTCHFEMEESFLPRMAGGLSKTTQKNNRIRRDEFIALIAEGKDYDKVIFQCTPSYNCDPAQKKSKKEVLLAGKVRFEWEIVEGEGNFVKMGILPKGAKTDAGDRVIFQPPYVPLTQNNATSTKTTVIFLRIIDETGAGVLLDEPVYDRITITTKRTRGNEDHYEVNVASLNWKGTGPSIGPGNQGVCEAAYGWEKDKDLKTPVIKPPPVADNNKMVLGQWMILEAENQNETDDLKMTCKAAACTEDGGRKSYPDDILWSWTIKDNAGNRKGRFIGGNTGRFVIFEAPERMPEQNGRELDILDVEVEVEVMNTGVQLNDKSIDGQSLKSKPFKISVYKPGVQLAFPPLTWVPENNNSVQLKSALLYHDGKELKAALAHMARIHFFELMNVSTEKGICLNNPVPSQANSCRDLLLKAENHTEVFHRGNDRLVCATNKREYYLHARSQTPQKEESVTVHSEDYGSYGFLRSFANINKGGKDSIRGERPVYVPVPVPDAQVKHPANRARVKHVDNRVTVPRDVDENKIADGGWRTAGNTRVNDPTNAKEDNDRQLPGDGFNGDGLSGYEEYRGFMIRGTHTRTHINNKDLFVHNPENFPLQTLENVVNGENGNRINVHSISEDEYISNNRREINFNYNVNLHAEGTIDRKRVPAPVQKGLFLRNGGAHAELLGVANPINDNFGPAPPNWILNVVIYRTSIQQLVQNRGNQNNRLNFGDKLGQIVAHELCHAMNVYHHGERNLQLGADGVNVRNGPRSGNVQCIMRYDNTGTTVAGLIIEAIGNILCTTNLGTGYNANNQNFGNCAQGRGNCIGQLRISGAESPPPSRR